MITVQAHNTYRLAAVVSAIVSRMGVFLLLITNLFLLACSGSSDGSDESQKPVDGPSVLDIYVYAPGQAVPTRGNVGEVDADAAENSINLLQIWVFTHDDVTPGNDGKLVTYFETTAFMDTSDDGTNKFELPIPDWFTDASPRPNVDVYVLANVSSNNCGFSFDEKTSKAALEAAVLAEGYFGLTSPVTEVPYEGLPMSGALRNQIVTGSRPILTLMKPVEAPAEPTEMAKVKLARVVSKVRFVFSCSNEFASLTITKVTLDEAMIPNEEYLFLTNPQYPDPDPDPNLSYTYTGNYYNINTAKGYNTGESPSLVSLDETTHCDDPAYYAWERLTYDKPASTAQDYEDLINAGLQTTYEGESGPRLTECRLYLRESDKRLKGKIYYQQKEKADDSYSSEKYVEFEMAAPDPESSDLRPYYFSRNHTWIVFAYLAWAKMNVVSVTVKPWFTTEFNRTLYNW